MLRWVLREPINLICLLRKLWASWAMHRGQRGMQRSVTLRVKLGRGPLEPKTRWASCSISHEFHSRLDTAPVSSPWGVPRRPCEASEQALRRELRRGSREPRPVNGSWAPVGSPVMSFFLSGEGAMRMGHGEGEAGWFSPNTCERGDLPICVQKWGSRGGECPIQRGWSSSITEQTLEKGENQRDWRFPRSFPRGSGFGHSEVRRYVAC